MSLMSDWAEFMHECSMCRNTTLEGGFLTGGIRGPWRYWVCIECEDYLNEIERHNYDLDEGKK